MNGVGIYRVITFISPITANERHMKSSLPLRKCLTVVCSCKSKNLPVVKVSSPCENQNKYRRHIVIYGAHQSQVILTGTNKHTVLPFYTHSNKYKSKYTLLGRQKRIINKRGEPRHLRRSSQPLVVLKTVTVIQQFYCPYCCEEERPAVRGSLKWLRDSQVCVQQCVHFPAVNVL